MRNRENKTETQLDSIRIEEGEFKTRLTRNFKSRKGYEPLNLNLLKSEIPGTVKQIMTEVGAEVQIGDMLMELEAMKMYNKILSPVNGTVKAIHVKVGERIPKAFLMIEFK